MYSYEFDNETGGLLLNTSPMTFSKEPRPVYAKELDILGFDKYWKYEKQDELPYMWAEATKYYYFGRLVARTKGGNLYSAPEIEIIEEPEPNNNKLKTININKMLEKNKDYLNVLEQETVKRIYEVWKKYKSKLDVFYVAFSGGKDSIVLLDLVKKAIPKDAFISIFGDTQMEFFDTYEVVDNIELQCQNEGIKFLKAKSHMDIYESWEKFGPPSRAIRWCCTVMKTAPVINLINREFNTKKLMMLTGVRRLESVQRSEYEDLSLGNKVAGQYSFHPILDWSSAEVFTYIYYNKLIISNAYKKGFSRVGCMVCPNSSGRHEYIKRTVAREQVDKYMDIIANTTTKDLSGKNRESFLSNGGWKMRTTGHELTIRKKVDFYEEKTKYISFEIRKNNSTWKKWYKTIGKFSEKKQNELELEYNNKIFSANIFAIDTDKNELRVHLVRNTKENIGFVLLLKSIIIKSNYCIKCGDCIAECPYGNITFINNEIEISDNCIRCKKCLKMKNSCTYYNSIKDIKGEKKMTGLNRYLSVGVTKEWIEEYFQNGTEPGSRKTDVMYAFLTDCGILNKKKVTLVGESLKRLGFNDLNTWAIMLCELVYSPAFNWYCKNIPFNVEYTMVNLKNNLDGEVNEKSQSEFWNGFKQILDTMPLGAKLGFGIPSIERKTNKNGEIKKTLHSINRIAWNRPTPEVILYSLYKYAEKCNNLYEFTLSRLYNFELETTGISPAQIFGTEREEMIQILNGLSAKYSEFINVTFTHDLEKITLRENKNSKDVIKLLEVNNG